MEPRASVRKFCAKCRLIGRSRGTRVICSNLKHKQIHGLPFENNFTCQKLKKLPSKVFKF